MVANDYWLAVDCALLADALFHRVVATCSFAHPLLQAHFRKGAYPCRRNLFPAACPGSGKNQVRNFAKSLSVPGTSRDAEFPGQRNRAFTNSPDRKSTRLNSSHDQ